MLPLLPEPRTQEDLDREDAERRERVRADLAARGIDPEEVRAAVGSGRFVEVGRAVLAVAKYHERTSGEPKTLAELLRIVADLEGAHLHLRERTSRESRRGRSARRRRRGGAGRQIRRIWACHSPSRS